jgi:uncharacterized protein with PQ loop repeat
MNILGSLATGSTLVCIGIGLTSQVLANYQRKSCEGVSKPLFISVFFVYLLWFAYGVQQHNWFLMAANAPGWMVTGIILGQFVRYRHPQ